MGIRNTNSGGALRQYAQNGDEVAFRSVVQTFSGMVHGVALRKTGNPDLAKEVAQRVFIALAKKAERVSSADSVGAWLHRAATLEGLKVLREQRRHRDRIQVVGVQLRVESEAPPEWSEALTELDEAFDSLSAKERRVLMLHYGEGHSYPEMARVLAISSEAARKRCRRALERLAELLRRRGVGVPLAILSSGLAAEYAQGAPLDAEVVATTALQTNLGASGGLSSPAAWWLALCSCKYSALTAVVVGAAVPVGIDLSRSADQPMPSNVAVDPARSPKGGERPLTPTVRSPRDRLRSVFRQLDEGLAEDEALLRRAQRLIFSLSDEDLLIARELLGSVENVDRFLDIAKAIYARWAESDPEAAVAAAARKTGPFGYYPMSGAFETWTVLDAEAALDWLLKAETELDLKFMGYAWLRRTAREDAAEAVAVLEGLVEGKPAWKEEMSWALLDGWGKSDPEAALKWVLTQEGQEGLLTHLVKAAGEQTPRTALQVASHMQHPEKKIQALWDVVWWWALDRPDDLIDFASSDASFAELDPDSLRAIGEGLARNRPAEVVAIAQGVPEGSKRDSLLGGMLRGVTEAKPKHFVAAAEQVSDDYVGRELSGDFMHFLRSWVESDRRAAKAWIEALPPGEKRRLGEMSVRLGPPIRAQQ